MYRTRLKEIINDGQKARIEIMDSEKVYDVMTTTSFNDGIKFIEQYDFDPSNDFGIWVSNQNKGDQNGI